METQQTNERSKPLEPGIVYLPYTTQVVKTMINNDTVWYRNKFLNFLLKVKWFFFGKPKCFTGPTQGLITRYAKAKDQIPNKNGRIYTNITIPTADGHGIKDR